MERWGVLTSHYENRSIALPFSVQRKLVPNGAEGIPLSVVPDAPVARQRAPRPSGMCRSSWAAGTSSRAHHSEHARYNPRHWRYLTVRFFRHYTKELPRGGGGHSPIRCPLRYNLPTVIPVNPTCPLGYRNSACPKQVIERKQMEDHPRSSRSSLHECFIIHDIRL